MSLGLVSYGSSDEESSDVENEEEQTVGVRVAPSQQKTALPAPTVKENFTTSTTSSGSEVEPERSKNEVDIHISDEEDDYMANGHDDSSFFEETEPDLLSLISKKLPRAKKAAVAKADAADSTFTDTNEDLSSIPAKKDYGEKPEEPPGRKRKRNGPVKITIPSLKDLQPEEDDEADKRPKVQASKKGSGLFSVLPQPKNTMLRYRPNNTAVPETGEDEPEAKQPRSLPSDLEANAPQNNLKPRGVRTLGFVPHIIANPVAAPPKPTETKSSASASSVAKPVAAAKKPTPADGSDSDSDEDLLGVSSGSYFPAPQRPEINAASVKPTVNANPETSYVYGLKRPPPKLPTVNPDFIPLSQPEDDFGPATAPYPPPAPANQEPGQYVEDEDAITRLAGKAAKRRDFKEDLNIIDIHEDDMKADPREWLTKAMTDEPQPSAAKKGPKGLVKSRHQITYLAHQAKERDFELRQGWAAARENKRASANKYGF